MTMADGTSMTVAEYFRRHNKYPITLKEKQPTLFVNQNGSRIYLPSELCYSSSLPKNFTSDATKMRNLSSYRITSANDRLTKILKMVRNLSLIHI
jgi:hypothetical protein